jgi:hypothetical protein
MKDKAVRLYRQAFDATNAQGIWSQPQFADQSKMRLGLSQVLDTIIGQVAMEQYSASATPSDEPGFDAHNGGEPAARKPAPEDDDDEYTKTLLETHRRLRGSDRYKTVGQLRREQREAALKKG